VTNYVNVLILRLSGQMTSRSDLNGKDRPVELLNSVPQVEGHLLQAVLAVEELADFDLLVSVHPNGRSLDGYPVGFSQCIRGAIFK